MGKLERKVKRSAKSEIGVRLADSTALRKSVRKRAKIENSKNKRIELIIYYIEQNILSTRLG